VTIDIPPPLHRLLQHVHLAELKNRESVPVADIYYLYGIKFTDESETYLIWAGLPRESGFDP
jgi:hypothetical protein